MGIDSRSMRAWQRRCGVLVRRYYNIHASTSFSSSSVPLPSSPLPYAGKIAKIETDVNFEESLRATVEQWQKENLKSGWLEIPIDQASLIEVAHSLGFDF